MLIVGNVGRAGKPGVIEVEDQTIVYVGLGSEEQLDLPPDADILGGPDMLVMPGLIDIQVNGFGGRSLNLEKTTPEDGVHITQDLRERGVALWCPTVTTGSFKRMSNSLRAIAEVCADPDIADSVAGIHMEGPFISGEDGPRGAHPVEHARAPDWDEFLRFQDAAGGHIRIVTLAPELPGAMDFIEKLSARGIIPAIGHTGASPEQIRQAVQAGARLSTHLGNGAHDYIRRHPNYIWEQLAADELFASIIPDGHHLSPSVVKCFIRCKGIERTILVSDAVSSAGMPPGEYEFSGRAVELTPEGRVQLKGTPYLAGSALELPGGLLRAAEFAGLPLEDTIRMATLNPARLVGIEDRCGTIEAGKDATVSIFRWDEEQAALEPHATIVRGRVVAKPA